MAAVLAAGPGAALSHRSAGALFGLRHSDRLEVTAPRRRRLGPGITLHRSALAADEVTALDGIPVTTVPRTLFDLSAVLGPGRVARAVHEAEVRGLADPLPLSDLVERYPRRRGVATIRAILAERRPAAVTRTELEDRFLAFLDEGGLPRPEVNASLFVGGRGWSATACGGDSVSSSSLTAGPPMPRPPPSSGIASATASSPPPRGSLCGSPGGSCSTTRTRSPPTYVPCFVRAGT